MNKRLLRGRAGWHVPPTGDGSFFWSDPSAWGGSVPTTNDAVTIPAGVTILLDTSTASLASLTIAGTLKNYGNTSANITTGYALVDTTGTLQIGTEDAPFTGNCTIELTGTETSRATRYVADRSATSGTGNGTLKQLFASTGAVAETITVTWSSSTAFSVSGTVSGSLGSGTVGVLFNNKVRFIATAGSTPWANGATNTITMIAKGSTNDSLPRSLQKMPGGVISLVGNPPAVVRTRLNADLAISATSLTLADAVTWNNDDQIVVGPTDFNSTTSGVAELFTLNGNVSASTTCPVDVAATRYKWGVLQYPVDSSVASIGVSLTAGTLTNDGGSSAGEWDLIPKVLDERAPVINLTRNIKVQGTNDSAWSTDRFGGHCMFMGLAGQVHIDGVEFIRMGQKGAIGRYPIHWHMLSYNMPNGMTLPSDGTFLGATSHSDNYIKRSSIYGSPSRAIVLHGTHGVLVQKNVCYDITSHAIFLEDGSEEQNTLDQNVVIQVNIPSSGDILINSETAFVAGGDGGSSAYWLSNPYNTVTDNWAFDAEVGFWNSFAGSRCFGLSEDVAIVPKTRPVLAHTDNVGACCTKRGFMTEFPPTDNRGTVETNTFFAGSLVAGSRFDFTRNIAYKNLLGAYLNRVNAPGFYNSWTVADNGQVDFSGQAGHDVFLRRTLMIGVSLNNGNSAETYATNTRKAGFVSYDEGFVVKDIIACNYPVRLPPVENRNSYGGQATALQGGGLVRMGEYIFPIWTFTQYDNWKTVGCTPGYMVSPPHFDGNGSIIGGQRFTLGILRDVTGLFTGTPGRHVVYNDPFYTTDATDLQDWSHSDAKHTSSSYFAINSVGAVTGIYTTNYFTPNQPFYIERQDSGGLVVGNWQVPDSRSGSTGLDYFKHCAVMRGGIYKITWNGELPSGSPTFAIFGLQFMHAAADTATIGVAWPNGTAVGTVYIKYIDASSPSLSAADLSNTAGSPPLPYALKFNNTSMTSRADVIADTTGQKFWQDTTNNVVWLKLKGGLIYDEQRLVSGTSNLDPNRQMMLCVTSQSLP